jgi:toxin YoeB
MRKLWHDSAWADYEYWQGQDRKTLRKLNSLIRDIERNGYGGVGKPEPLKGGLSGWWSVRIDDANRIVFRVAGEVLEILACRGHYGAR